MNRLALQLLISGDLPAGHAPVLDLATGST